MAHDGTAVEHPVAVRANQNQIVQTRGAVRPKTGDRNDVVTFDEPAPDGTVLRLEVQPADLAVQSAVLAQCLFLLQLHDTRVALVGPVQSVHLSTFRELEFIRLDRCFAL